MFNLDEFLILLIVLFLPISCNNEYESASVKLTPSEEHINADKLYTYNIHEDANIARKSRSERFDSTTVWKYYPKNEDLEGISLEDHLEGITFEVHTESGYVKSSSRTIHVKNFETFETYYITKLRSYMQKYGIPVCTGDVRLFDENKGGLDVGEDDEELKYMDPSKSNKLRYVLDCEPEWNIEKPYDLYIRLESDMPYSKTKSVGALRDIRIYASVPFE
jgi:hypothetical protein